MKKTIVYISVSSGDSYLTIDGDLELLSQLLALALGEHKYITCADQNTDFDQVQEEKP